MMRTLAKMTFFLSYAALGISLPMGACAIANSRNRHFVEVHNCSLMLSRKSESIVVAGMIMRVEDETFYQCKEPDLVVEVDGRPAGVR